MEEAHVALRLERSLAGQHLVENAAETVHVAPAVDHTAGDLLGTHVRRRSDPQPCGSDLLAVVVIVDGLGDAEVDDLDDLAGVVDAREHHVVRLQVAMGHRRREPVRGRECVRDLAGDVDGPCDRKWSMLGEYRRERRTIDQLHRDVQAAGAGVATVVDRRDVLMADPRCVQRFTLESAERGLVVRGVRTHQLDGVVALHRDVAGGIHPAHPALANLAQHHVASADHLLDQRVGGVTVARFGLAVGGRWQARRSELAAVRRGEPTAEHAGLGEVVALTTPAVRRPEPEHGEPARRELPGEVQGATAIGAGHLADDLELPRRGILRGAQQLGARGAGQLGGDIHVPHRPTFGAEGLPLGAGLSALLAGHVERQRGRVERRDDLHPQLVLGSGRCPVTADRPQSDELAGGIARQVDAAAVRIPAEPSQDVVSPPGQLSDPGQDGESEGALGLRRRRAADRRHDSRLHPVPGARREPTGPALVSTGHFRRDQHRESTANPKERQTHVLRGTPVAPLPSRFLPCTPASRTLLFRRYRGWAARSSDGHDFRYARTTRARPVTPAQPSGNGLVRTRRWLRRRLATRRSPSATPATAR